MNVGAWTDFVTSPDCKSKIQAAINTAASADHEGSGELTQSLLEKYCELFACQLQRHGYYDKKKALN
jgi:hypothetical protein